MRRLVILLGVVVLAGALGYASLPVGTAPSSGPRASAGKARSGEGAAEARGGLFSSGGLLSGSGGEVEGTYVVGPLAEGRYVLQAETYTESSPEVFLPTPVDVPATGTVNLEARERGTNEEVRAPDGQGR